jgi:hypothetical protein
MKFLTPTAVIAAVVFHAVIRLGGAFQPSYARTSNEQSKRRFTTIRNAVDDAANSPYDIPVVDPLSVTARDLRSISVTNANGTPVPLGDAMGSGTSVVVFLRHLG